MGKRTGRTLALAGVQTADKTEDELKAMFHDILKTGMHGICFSLYEDGQQPGDVIGEEQIRRRVEILKPHTEWIRSFSCIEGNELIPRMAKEHGIKTMVGAWLGDDFEKNEEEIEGLISLAKQGLVDVAAVGNEVMYREEMTEDQLIAYINRVKEALPGIPVGYADAYYEFRNRPRITEACDVILTNCYPFWEGCHIDYSFLYMKDMYNQAKAAGKGKRVIITETGWPSEGGGFEGSRAGKINFLKYFIDAQIWSDEEDIEMFYFSSFDESWKVGPEDAVGAYWGLWDKHEKLKF